MPTGYTDKIAEGISFKEFLFTCARAFGAMIHAREDPLDETLPLPEPPNIARFDNQIAKQIQLLSEISTLTECQIQDKIDEETREFYKSKAASLAKTSDLKAKYEKMLERVYEWVPPSIEHENLKKFMEEQIKESIQFDCSTSLYDARRVDVTPKEWIKRETQKVTDYISSLTNHKLDEIKRYEEQRAWIVALVNSVRDQ